jgi:uncharacterized protein YqjF (DUF2071 family)
MSSGQSSIDRISPTVRPAGSVAGYHNWSNLLFVHWRVPADMIQQLLPPQLTVDTWEGDAWVGMVPFMMSGVRPWWSPAVPGVSRFCETNVRTYVHLDGQDPGVWFFSLEAAQSLAVLVARSIWKLPYYKARMKLERNEKEVHYQSHRLWPGSIEAISDIHAKIGDLVNLDSNHPGRAVPGTLEFFLAERYLLYSTDEKGRLYRGQVYHTPYPLRDAEVSKLDQSLLPATGIKPPNEFCHALFCDGVEVEVFPLQAVS